MMRVYLGMLCYDNHCEIRKHVERVFDDEAKALVWTEESFTTDPDEWREYEEREVE